MATEMQIETQPEKASIIVKRIDFKMITFTLAGKDYGVDIMKVKEIRKANQFTHVPNAPVFVRGVDNLRGDIIPIIDLRIMFNLPAERRGENDLENIIILRVGEIIIGVIVDTIEKVVGISRDSIQPPHPIFGDINVKYISGVVENEGKLYIILDSDRIFSQEKDKEERTQAAATWKPRALEAAAAPEVPVRAPEELNLQFFTETLATFAGFRVTSLNQDWVRHRAREWEEARRSAQQEVQLTSEKDAQDFLQPFYSEFTDRLWDKEALDQLFGALDLGQQGQIQVWNPGCGRGLEAYSLAVGLKIRFPGRPFKIWANDKDLLNISSAPSLGLPTDQVPAEYRPYLVETRTGYQFTADIKTHILFEFHDVLNMNPYDNLHLVVIRDVLSFLNSADQERLLDEIHEKLRPGGYLLLGKNEKLGQDNSGFLDQGVAGLSLYRKKE